MSRAAALALVLLIGCTTAHGKTGDAGTDAGRTGSCPVDPDAGDIGCFPEALGLGPDCCSVGRVLAVCVGTTWTCPAGSRFYAQCSGIAGDRMCPTGDAGSGD